MMLVDGATIVPSCKCNGVTLIRDSCFLELNQINCVLSGFILCRLDPINLSIASKRTTVAATSAAQQ